MIIVLSLFILAIDLISKLVVSHFLYVNESVEIIKNFLSITYVKNTGAAWSLFDDKSFIVIILSAIIIILLIMYVKNNRTNILGEKIAYSLILGGAIGNFLNRIFYGYVIDFIDIEVFGYDYPIFNLADIFIVAGVVILVILTWRCNSGDKRFR